MVGTILERIIETKLDEVAEAKRRRPVEALKRDIAPMADPRDFFSAVVTGGSDVHLIAEVKKASPSAGLIRPDFDPVSIARDYEEAGASALSVLTDRTYFQGDLAFISRIKDVVSLPVLRKDFIVDEYQVHESRAAGADAILLIAAVLSPVQIGAWIELSFNLGMASLVEVHDVRELGLVRDLIGSRRRALLGINNRDLRVQQVDLQNTHRLAGELAAGTPFVAESGIRTRDDVLLLRRSGATALLVGETLMSADDPGAKLRELLGR